MMEATPGQVERYVAEAGEAGVTVSQIDSFLTTNPGSYDELWQLYTGPVVEDTGCMCFHAPCNCGGTSWPADTVRPGTVDTGVVVYSEPAGPPVSLAMPASAGLSPVVLLVAVGLVAWLVVS